MEQRLVWNLRDWFLRGSYIEFQEEINHEVARSKGAVSILSSAEYRNWFVTKGTGVKYN
jgi:hypothetical protein